MIHIIPTPPIADIEMLKATLLTGGVSIAPSAQRALRSGDWKRPRLVRSGMSSGLEFTLKHDGRDIAISCAVSMGKPAPGGFQLLYDGGFFLHDSDGNKCFDVELFRRPSYYDLETSSGQRMASIAQQCFTRLAIGVFGVCTFSSNQEFACAFCAISHAAETDSPRKTDQDIMETVDAVRRSELNTQIETVMLGGGTPNASDRGAKRFARLAERIAGSTPWRVTAMMTPPSSDDDLQLMRDCGVQELSVNLEFGSREAFEHYTPGKNSVIGRKRYEDCLEAAVDIFGVGNVQSLLVIGLEDYEASLNAVRFLAEKKVVPVLSPFRPLPDTPLAAHPAPTAREVVDFYKRARAVVAQHDIFLGPRCIPCQCNTMTLPWDVK